ncbi:hypothetical protein Tco_0738388, partial [Tanacetum coccineum]
LNTRVSKVKVNIVIVNGVNTVGQTTVSIVKGNGVTAAKASAGCVKDLKKTDLNNGSKDNSRSWVSKRVNYIDPQGRLKFQVQPKVSHLNAVKRIFRYLKGRPNLGLWYPKDSPFILEAFSDSDYTGASLDRKSTTGGCQFIGSRLISWQCKKQTVVANSTTEAEYIAASHCCGQVLWIQNQMC